MNTPSSYSIDSHTTAYFPFNTSLRYCTPLPLHRALIMASTTTTTFKFPHVPPAGVWVPTVTYFSPDTHSLDLAAQAKYYTYLASTGLAGLVILGTNSETFLLTREERLALIQCAREAVGPDFPLMAGIGGHSTKQVLEFADDAYKAGANYTLCLPAAYFGKATTNAVVESFFRDVAEGSRLPVVLYNFPAVTNGVDMDSELITKMAKENSNIVGVKLTCASVGKIVRLAATFKPEEFAVYGGQSDFIIGGLSAGSAGCIAGFANIFPKTIVQIYKLYKAGKIDEALELHKIAALAESPCKAGIASVKYGVSLHSALEAGIENPGEKLKPRKPYEEASDAAKKGIRDAFVFIEKKEVSL